MLVKVVAAACALLVAACDSTTGPEGTRFAPFASDSVFIGRTLGIVTLSNADGNVVTAAPQVWTSSDTNVAIVVAGRVLAVGSGTAVISAELDGHTNTATVRVVPQWFDNATTFARTSTGYWANCAITSLGAVACRSRTDPDSVRGFTEVGAGAPAMSSLHIAESHQCGLAATGQMFCRGWNVRGQLGLGRTSVDEHSVFVASAGDLRFSAVSTGGTSTRGHSCGIQAADQVLYCFGSNDVGQTGHTPIETDSVAAPVAGGFRALAVAAGRRHTCAVATDNQAYCWGLNISGALGRPRADVNFTGTPQIVTGFTFSQLSADVHTCGVTMTRELYCWGANAGGQLGIGTRDNLEHPTPTRVPLDVPIQSVITANGFTCAIAEAGDLYCWGSFPMSYAMADQLGNQRDSPVHVARGVRFRSVSASAFNICGVTNSNRLMCF